MTADMATQVIDCVKSSLERGRSHAENEDKPWSRKKVQDNGVWKDSKEQGIFEPYFD
jgi:hypothetical protein